jgi:hypothetical protein
MRRPVHAEQIDTGDTTMGLTDIDVMAVAQGRTCPPE